MQHFHNWLKHAAALIALFCLVGCGSSEESGQLTLLNVSYDPTRELYREVNEAFAQEWQQKTGERLTIKQSHGGSGSQARAVIDGLAADVVTLALAYDIDSIQRTGKRLGANWQTRYPNSSSPYTSTIVFLVREGNPKNIRDWSDLVRPGISVITPNPKTSGGARWNYLAAWGAELQRQLGGDLSKLENPDDPQVQAAQRAAQEFVATIYRNAPVLDSGARGSTNTFVQRDIGDVLLTWENEAILAKDTLGSAVVDMVIPSTSILAQPPVAIVDTVVDRRGTRQVAEAYLRYLYSPTGQALAAKHHFRPTDPEVLAQNRAQFPELNLFTIDQAFGGWDKAHAAHFADGAIFDRITGAGARR